MPGSWRGRQGSKDSCPGSSKMLIRKAVIEDVKPIHRILSYYAAQGSLLPRPLSELYDHLRDFFVLVENSQEPKVLGVCALGVCWEDLAEIRSLAVDKDEQRKGFGLQLVKTCLEEAHALGLRRVFALTYVEGFFDKVGFKKVEKSVLPHKVWADCLKCPKFPDCDETAMILEL
jgi:amino-acid N-acetyltransferase